MCKRDAIYEKYRNALNICIAVFFCFLHHCRKRHFVQKYLEFVELTLFNQYSTLLLSHAKVLENIVQRFLRSDAAFARYLLQVVKSYF